MPAISVIVPVYKVEAFLNRCVDSLLGQSYSDFQLILVDDGSPDRCGAICEEYAARDSRVHVIHQKNAGLSAARNTGIDWSLENTSSQWLAFVDSDDWVHREYLQRLYTAAVQTGCKMAVCDFFQTAGGGFPECLEEEAKTYPADEYYCSEEIHGGRSAVAWNKLYHRSLFQSLRYPVGKLHEDEFLTYQLAFAAERVAVLRSKLYAYYQNPQGIILSQWNPRRMHILEAAREQIAFAKQTGNDRFLCKAVEQYIMCCDDQLQKADPQYHRQLRKQLRQGLKLGRECGVFPLTVDRLWAYEKAYPVKPFWWLFFKIHGLVAGLRRKENAHG